VRTKRIRVPLSPVAKQSAAVREFIAETRALLAMFEQRPDVDGRRRALSRLATELLVAVNSKMLERYIQASVDPGDLEELRQALVRLEAEQTNGGWLPQMRQVRELRDRVMHSYLGQLRPPEEEPPPATGVPRKPRPAGPPGHAQA